MEQLQEENTTMANVPIINYIYLLIKKEHILSKQNIYKIGKSTQYNHKRFKQYPNDSILLLQSNCNNCNIIENMIIHLFKQKYTHMSDIGKEYFKGDFLEMKDDINTIIKNNNNLTLFDIITIKENEIKRREEEKLKKAQEKQEELELIQKIKIKKKELKEKIMDNYKNKLITLENSIIETTNSTTTDDKKDNEKNNKKENFIDTTFIEFKNKYLVKDSNLYVFIKDLLQIFNDEYGYTPDKTFFRDNFKKENIKYESQKRTTRKYKVIKGAFKGYKFIENIV
jgi:hypothetical protein